MKALVVGYNQHRKGEVGKVLYAGNDRVAANEALNAGGTGIRRAVLFLHPSPFKTRSFEIPEGEEIPSEVTVALEMTPELQAALDVQLEKCRLELEARIEEANAAIVPVQEELARISAMSLEEFAAFRGIELPTPAAVAEVAAPAPVAEVPDPPVETPPETLDLKAPTNGRGRK